MGLAILPSADLLRNPEEQSVGPLCMQRRICAAIDAAFCLELCSGLCGAENAGIYLVTSPAQRLERKIDVPCALSYRKHFRTVGWSIPLFGNEGKGEQANKRGEGRERP